MAAIRLAMPDEAGTLTDLCIRSKAMWGYDAAFLRACREELTITEQDIRRGYVAVAEIAGMTLGVVWLNIHGEKAELSGLFVDPAHVRLGVGKKLFAWACTKARRLKADSLVIDADPNAVTFYQRMGAVDNGSAASGSIPGRMLPRLIVRL